MIVGATGAGKSSCYRILCETITDIRIQNLSND